MPNNAFQFRPLPPQASPPEPRARPEGGGDLAADLPTDLAERLAIVDRAIAELNARPVSPPLSHQVAERLIERGAPLAPHTSQPFVSPSVSPSQPPSPAPLPQSVTLRRVGADLRSAPRHRTLIGGKIVWDEGRRSMDCAIRDLSDTGARVRLSGTEILPGRIFLIEMRQAVAFEAQPAWKRGSEVGLKFIEAHSLHEPNTSVLRVMRQIWLENCVR